MQRNYVILRKPQEIERNSGMRGGEVSSAASRAAPPPLEFRSMSDREADDLMREKDVDTVVPGIPLKLIRPIPLSEPRASSKTVAWGIEAVGATRSIWTGKGVKVAILDTGIDGEHEAFQGVKLTQRDYTGEGNGDRDGHGTHCAATIFGRDVDGVRIGVAPGVSQAFIAKVIGRNGGGTDVLLKAIQDAVDEGYQIISMSLGFDFPGAVARLQEHGFPADLAAALALGDYRANVRLFDRLGTYIQAKCSAAQREVLIFAASGNESQRNVDPRYEMPAAPPSEADGFTSVGALGRNPDGKLGVASFSNCGCNICAPGVEILSAKAGTRNEIIALSGTSMATPHAAGVAALFVERDKKNAPICGYGYLRGRQSLLTRILGQASPQPLAPGFTAAQVGLGLIQAPTE